MKVALGKYTHIVCGCEYVGDFHLLKLCLHIYSIEINKVNYNIDLISLCIDNILGFVVFGSCNYDEKVIIFRYNS